MKGNVKTLCVGDSIMAKYNDLQVLDIAEAVPLYKGIALQKDSEFTMLLNHHLLKMFENGEILKIKHKWTAKYDQEYGMEEPVELGYEHVLFPYASLALGVVITLPMVIGEICFKRWATSMAKVSYRKRCSVLAIKNSFLIAFQRMQRRVW